MARMRQPRGGDVRNSAYYPDHFLHSNEPPVDYFDVPPPANDNATVVRAVERQQPYDGLPSANVRKAYVRLPRVTMLDGAYRPTADNDNRSQPCL